MTAPGPAVRALLAWQRAAGPYWSYVCAAPFLAEGITPRALFPRPTEASHALVETVCREGEEKRLIVVDLPARVTLAATPELHRLGYRVVPIIQRWIVPNAVLPSRRLLNALVGIAQRAARPVEPIRGVVICLDGERSGRVGASGSASRFDNRYAYPVCRFPPARLLQSDGVAAVTWISNGPLAADLLPYRESLTPDLPSRDISLAGPDPISLGAVS